MNDFRKFKNKTQSKKDISWKKQFSDLLTKLRYEYGEIIIKKLKPSVVKYSPRLHKFYSKIKNILYRGDNFYCPCCRRSFRKFYPFGKGGLRKSAMCPGCGSLERHRLILLYLKLKTVFFSKKHKVLHFSPAPILQKIFKKMPNLDYISVDLDSPLTMLNMDIMNLLFDDNIFDTILCCHVLEHVHDDGLAMRELYRVLKPNGWAILQVPLDTNRKETFEDPKITSPKDQKRFFGHYSHVRIYGLDYIERLKRARFNVKVDDFFSKFDNDKIIKKFGLIEKDDIYYCTK